MTSRQLLDGMGAIDSAYIDEAGAALGCNDSIVRNDTAPRRTPRKIMRTLLIAAIIAALLTATAFAAGWFGLGGLKTADDFNGSGMARISLQGLSDTAESKAASEWLDYRDEENNSQREYNDQLAQSAAEKYGTYGVANQKDLDMLKEICDKYSLQFLGTSVTQTDERTFCESAGVGRLTGKHDDYANQYLSSYVYSSGTFHMEGDVYTDAHPYDIRYQLRNAKKGVMDYVNLGAADINSFTEWDYVTESGITLHLANTAPEADTKQSFIFLDTADAFITVNFMHDGYANYYGDGVIDGIGDEYVSFDIADSELELLAECFDWEAFSDQTRGMDGEFTERVYNARVDAAALIAVKDKAADYSAAEGDEGKLYFLKLTYAEEIEEYIAGFRLIDCIVAQGVNNCVGWMRFAGVAKAPLDWAYTEENGERVYCRSVNLSKRDGAEWSCGAGFDMHPVQLEQQCVESTAALRCIGAPLDELKSAEMYVQSTGESYTITDPDALNTLGRMLRFNPIPGGRIDCSEWNPIYLDYADGRSALVYAPDTGENLVLIYGRTQSYMLGVSIFDVFNVPLDAKGYTEHDGIITTHIDRPEGSLLATVEYDYIKGGDTIERRSTDEFGETRARRFEYDADGKLVRETISEPDGTIADERVYTYDDNGRLVNKHTQWDSAWTDDNCFYDEAGRMIRIESYDNERPTTPFYTWYTYNEDGSVTVESGYK